MKNDDETLIPSWWGETPDIDACVAGEWQVTQMSAGKRPARSRGDIVDVRSSA